VEALADPIGPLADTICPIMEWPAPPSRIVEFRIMRSGTMAKLAVLGIDLGKNVCSVVGLDEARNVVLRRRMKRGGLPSFAERLAPCVIAMEACCGAHHLGRIFAARGHEVRLMSHAEAATRPTVRRIEEPRTARYADAPSSPGSAGWRTGS
jgi:hypothetical protein